MLFAIFLSNFEMYLKQCLEYNTIVYLQVNDMGDVIDTTDDKMKMMGEWFGGNKLKLNIDKTKPKCFIMQKRIISNHKFINIDEMNVGLVENMKYLGL